MAVPVTQLRNIGAKTAGWLHDIGVHTDEDLRALGSIAVYRRLKQRFPRQVSLNALWGLEATLLGIRWDELTEDIEQELRNQLAQFEE